MIEDATDPKSEDLSAREALDALWGLFGDSILYTLTPDLRIVSGDLAQLLGYETCPEMRLADWIDSIVDRGSASETPPILDRDNLGGPHTTLSRRYRLRRGDGSWSWVEDRRVHRTSSNGKAVAVGMLRDINELVKAKRQQMVSDASFSALVETLPFEIWTVGADGRYLMTNHLAQKTFGQVEGKLPTDLGLDPDTEQKWLGNNNRALQGETVRTEQSYLRGDREHVIQEILAPIVCDGDVIGAVGANLDVTKQKLDAESLLASEQRHQSLLQAIPDRVFLQEADGTYVDYHDSGVGRLVVPPSEFMGRRMQDVLPKEMLQSVEPAFQRVVETRMPQVAEYNTSGSERSGFMEARMVPCGETRVLTIVRNITDRRLAEITLEHQRSALEQIVSGASLEDALIQIIRGIEASCPGTLGSIILLDSDCRKVATSLAPSIGESYASLILGLEIGPSTGSCGTACYRREPVIVTDIESDPLWNDYRDIARRFDLKACWSYPILREDGEPMGSFAMYYRTQKGPTETELGLINEAIRVAGVAIHRHRIESELRELNNELERRVQERTQAFRISNDELESFSYSVAHDLRAPLRTIAGFSQILSEEYGKLLDEKGRDYVQRCIDAANNMGNIVDALLELSRINRGSFSIKEVDLTRLAHDVVADLMARQPHLPVEFKIQEGMRAQADPRLVMIALENLFNNALKFSKDRSKPTIEMGQTTSDGVSVFFVKDNGIGFDQAFANRLFNPFVSLHPGSPRKGDGIGLATVQRIVNRHGGRIWAEGEIDCGAKFNFTLGPGSHDAGA